MDVLSQETSLERFGPLLGRLLMATIFILGGISKIGGFSTTLHMMRAHEIPAAAPLLAIALAVEILGGLAILFGFKAKLAALLLFLYLIPVSLTMHAFWSAPAAMAQMQQINFLKNLAIMGGLLFIGVYGPGRFSLDKTNKWVLPGYIRQMTHSS